MVFQNYQRLAKRCARQAQRQVACLAVGDKKAPVGGFKTVEDLLCRPTMAVKRVDREGYLASVRPTMRSAVSENELRRSCRKEKLNEMRVEANEILQEYDQRHDSRVRDELRLAMGPPEFSSKDETVAVTANTIQPLPFPKENKSDNKMHHISFNSPLPQKSADSKLAMSPPAIRSAMRVQTLEESQIGSKPQDTWLALLRSGEATPTVAKAKRAPAKSVTFHNVEVREYVRCVGDNPACSDGPPVSLSWIYRSHPAPYTLEEYESVRCPHRRRGDDLGLTEEQRIEILLQLGYSVKELELAEIQKLKDQLLRESTLGNLNGNESKASVQDMFEKITRKYAARAAARRGNFLGLNKTKWPKRAVLKRAQP